MVTPRSLACSLCLAALLTALAAPAHAQCQTFRRGDANADASVDLSDAVYTLLHLFSGGATPTCLDAADADDSGAIELTDAVYLLGFLFVAQPAPPAPGPFECGAEDRGSSLGCEAHAPCDPPVERRDLSVFERFEYRQGPGLGFCPDETRIFEATVTRQNDGGHLLELALVRRGDEAVDECLFEAIPFGCFVREPLPARLLAPAEVDALRGVLGSLLIHTSADPICNCIAFDPCVVGSFAWDATMISHFLCSTPYVEGTSVAAVLEVLESFRPGQ